MKKLIILLLLASCSKSNDKPVTPPQPKWIVVNNYYVSQTWVQEVKLNGKHIMGLISPNETAVDSVDNPSGTVEITVSGGGGGDYISGPGSTITVPASATNQTFKFNVSGYSLFVIQK